MRLGRDCIPVWTMLVAGISLVFLCVCVCGWVRSCYSNMSPIRWKLCSSAHEIDMSTTRGSPVVSKILINWISMSTEKTNAGRYLVPSSPDWFETRVDAECPTVCARACVCVHVCVHVCVCKGQCPASIIENIHHLSSGDTSKKGVNGRLLITRDPPKPVTHRTDPPIIHLSPHSLLFGPLVVGWGGVGWGRVGWGRKGLHSRLLCGRGQAWLLDAAPLSGLGLREQSTAFTTATTLSLFVFVCLFVCLSIYFFLLFFFHIPNNIAVFVSSIHVLRMLEPLAER